MNSFSELKPSRMSSKLLMGKSDPLSRQNRSNRSPAVQARMQEPQRSFNLTEAAPVYLYSVFALKEGDCCVIRDAILERSDIHPSIDMDENAGPITARALTSLARCAGRS